MTQQEKLAQLYKTFYGFCENNHRVIFYKYQKKICEKILRAIFLRTGEEIFIEISRQAGKTEALVDCLEYCLIFYEKMYHRPLRVGIFAKQKEQTKTDFDRLKLRLAESQMIGFHETIDPNESNAVTLQLSNGCYVYTFPLTSTSNPESKTLDVIVYEEANKIDDEEKKNKSDPMGTSTNAVRISIGVGGYGINFFKRGVDRAGDNLIKADYKEVIADRREAYERDRNRDHLHYETYVNSELLKHGGEDDAFKTQYGLEWIIGVGQFATREQLDAIRGSFGLCTATSQPVVVGIDTAKHVDKTIVTVKNITEWKEEFNIKGKKVIKVVRPKSILCWFALQGDNYEDQFYMICGFLKNFTNIAGIAIDSTGQGDFMPDMFENHTGYEIIRVSFNLSSKDKLYKNLLVNLANKGTLIPDVKTREHDEFEQQLLDLQKEYKGEYLRCHHPDDPNAHDDYPDSWALAEWAEHWLYENGVDLAVVTSSSKDNKKERKGFDPFEGMLNDLEDDDD